VLGNSHARFLGEWWSATAATYPINIAFNLLILLTGNVFIGAKAHLFGIFSDQEKTIRAKG